MPFGYLGWDSWTTLIVYLQFSDKEEQFITELKAKYEILYHSVQPLPYIRDRMYCALNGFNEDIRDQYIRKAVVQGDEQAAREIILKLQRNPLLGDLCQVPLLFALFAHVSHENKDLKTFKSITSFFRNVIAYFLHLMNKTIKKVCFGSKHDELNKVAYEALSGRNQLIVWDSTSLRKRLRDDFYEQYLKTGIFFEEEVLTGDQFLYKKEVRFHHKLFCEWYAAHYIADYLSQESSTSATTESQSVAELLHCLDPFELHYVYRFACGLNKTASGKIVNYLQDNLKHEKFAMMCMLASKVVHIHGDDSQLLQRSTLQVLEFASAKQVKSFSFIAIKTYFLRFVVTVLYCYCTIEL
ncbi:hypothetical protein BSL78_26817 [Apostichopus japonicus]|uniref:Uncharacterized protein n=1 Tax=Stichopus japonicus TaxID=307972 RepID=A0A2G8JKS1_STIJA|nr:hypothetical protein BSL78_26817 [Apostichopus japonicus]